MSLQCNPLCPSRSVFPIPEKRGPGYTSNAERVLFHLSVLGIEPRAFVLNHVPSVFLLFYFVFSFSVLRQTLTESLSFPGQV